MVQIQLSVQNWVSLSQETREKLRAIFNVKRSTMTVVEDQKLKCDGSTYEDIGVITVEAMQDYLKSKEKDFSKLFLSVLDKVNGVIPPEAVEPEKTEKPKIKPVPIEEPIDLKEIDAELDKIIEPVVGVAPKKRGRPAKQ